MNNLILYGAIIIAIIVLAFSVYTMTHSYPYTEQNYQQAKAAEIPGNKCATPSGYTDIQWKQHMSHHPDQYAECLK